MSRANQLVYAVLDAAKASSVKNGIVDKTLNAALIEFEGYFIVNGRMEFEALRANDLNAMARIIKRAGKAANSRLEGGAK